MGGNRHIGLLVDEYSRLKFDIYISTKNQLQEQILALLKIIIINYKIKVQVIGMDNAGENIYIEQAIRSDPVLCEMGTVVDYTAPYTPQHVFPTMFSRARASYNRAKLPTGLQMKLFYDAFQDALQKDAILYTQGQDAGPPFIFFFGKVYLM